MSDKTWIVPMDVSASKGLRFEYKLEWFVDSAPNRDELDAKFIEFLNTLGSEGWELVHNPCTLMVGAEIRMGGQMLFKRARS